MIYVIYAVMAIVSLPLTLLAVILAPIMPIFTVKKLWWCNNHSYQAIAPVLPSWLNWFMTPDNSLDGDDTFQKANPPSYWSAVKWLWRNPAYSFGLKYISNKGPSIWYGDRTIKDNDGAKEGWLFVKSAGLFQFTYVKRIGSTNRCVYINLGWNIRALVDPNATTTDPYQATFVFSPRISGYR